MQVRSDCFLLRYPPRFRAPSPHVRATGFLFLVLVVTLSAGSGFCQQPAPTADEQTDTPQTKSTKEATSAQARPQAVNDTQALLQMATELKAELDKTSQDTLSLQVIRKAGQLEQAARSVKERMRASIASK